VSSGVAEGMAAEVERVGGRDPAAWGKGVGWAGAQGMRERSDFPRWPGVKWEPLVGPGLRVWGQAWPAGYCCCRRYC
jgi:hypothetical protein